MKKKNDNIKNEKQESYKKTNICNKTFVRKYTNDKNHSRVSDHCHYIEITDVLHIAYVIFKIVYLKKFVWFFTLDQTMTNILSYKS